MDIAPKSSDNPEPEIPDGKKVQDLLQASETRYRHLFETAQDGILIVEADTGQIVDVNTFLIHLLGSLPERFFGKKIWEIEHLRDIIPNKDHFEELRQKEYNRYEDRPLEIADGRHINVEFVSTSYIVDNKKVIQCRIRDITDRKRVEQALKESEERYNSLFINNYSVSLLIDPDTGMIVDANDAACQYYGYSKEQLTAMGIFDVNRLPKEKVVRDLMHAKDAGAKHFFSTHFLANGERRNVEVFSGPIAMKGKPLFYSIIHDITDRKRAEAEIQLLNATLEQRVRDRTQELEHATETIRASLDEKVILLREVHHRVKNNLQIIISLTNLQMRQIDDNQLKQVMVETQNRVRAMSFVHEKLYQSEDLSHIDISDYTRYLVTQLFASYSVNSQQVSLNLDSKKIMLNIDTAIPVGLIINELVSNSLKHAFPDGRKGEISIAIQREDHTLTILFKDNGIGIPEDFDWRNTTSLGLQLVITLVDQLDGTIELDRSSGTMFTIVVKEME